eukprot:CAMPEP_0115482196 /NCGR_PEP_ID=MMETSP0271-20121206/58201_1 /TAXON_ID=71861 /ORGANISM="Scrippsiella trochoidea, Strain CCMP3099" /LENGTH=86 /DNA_ID=CAMNT_0002909979 /DNA_START=210 /DNA_END=470 /DNA_ORIENTATION=-
MAGSLSNSEEPLPTALAPASRHSAAVTAAFFFRHRAEAPKLIEGVRQAVRIDSRPVQAGETERGIHQRWVCQNVAQTAVQLLLCNT